MYITNQKDFYKTDHIRQYPEDSELVFSNMTARSSKLFKYDKFDGKVAYVGMNRFVKQVIIGHWNNEFFNANKRTAVRRYKRRLDTSLGPNAVNVEHFEALHDLGYLPLEIRSLPEGSLVNIGVPMFVVYNTKPEFYWLTNDQETLFSVELWKTITVATIAHQYKKLLTQYAINTAGDLGFVPFQAHDFSFRGMSCMEDAAKSGIGHLATGFVGTDTIPAIDTVEDYYNVNADNYLIGTSVYATEHSVMSFKGRAGEFDTFERLLTKVYPSSVVSIVSDTYNLWKVIDPKDGYLVRLKQVILNRKPDANGLAKTVIRPDSGDPIEILCGIKVNTILNYKNFDQWKEIVAEEMDEKLREETPHGECGGDLQGQYYYFGETVFECSYSPEWNRHDKQYYYIDNWGSKVSKCTFTEIELTTEQKGVIQCLWEIFGGTINDKGYKVLDSHIGAIYGDSITLQRADAILDRLKRKGYCSTNIVFGIGSYTYQYITRDTFGMAIKATAGKIAGEYVTIQKDPITGDGVKKSAAGFLKVIKEGDDFKLVQNVTFEEMQAEDNLLQPIFRDGKLLIDPTFIEIRERLAL